MLMTILCIGPSITLARPKYIPVDMQLGRPATTVSGKLAATYPGLFFR